MSKDIINLTHIGIFDNVISPEKCQDIIEQYQLNAHRHEPGKVAAGTWEGKITTDWNIISDLDQNVDTLIFETFSSCFKKYIEKFDIEPLWLPDSICDSGYKVMKYDKGKGIFDTHTDNDFQDSTERRFLTALLYLNTIKEGGETKFQSQGVIVKPKAGRVVMFPSFFTHPHTGNMPLSKDKYVINTFFMRDKR
tara:strand:- start:3075 stop:3656 length:582 start_codon:yes stop_codon:yes gene_type:complete